MHKQKAERYADEIGLTNPSRSRWEALIDEYILSERDRYLLRRYIVDGVPVGDYLLQDIADRFPYAPLEENGARKVIRRCIHCISKNV